MPRIRLFVNQEIATRQSIELDAAQSHYLIRVMRQQQGDVITIFNSTDGQWQASISHADKKHCVLHVDQCTRTVSIEPDVWLCFAPVKHQALHNIIEKGTELGVSVFQPVRTERTVVHRLNYEQLQKNAIEAAEQCERLSVPNIQEMVSLPELLQHWDLSRTLFYCDETGKGSPIAQALRPLPALTPAAFLIGPEGGFTPHEFDSITQHSFATAVTMGPRILRADTAALAALTCYMNLKGDWHLMPTL